MRFSEPVMVVPRPPRWSTIAVITQLSSLGFVPAYLPLLLSNLSLRPSLPCSSFCPRCPRSRALNSLVPSLLRFLPAFISIRALPSACASSRSVIIPSIPSRSFRPHIIRGCTRAHTLAHIHGGARNRPRASAGHGIISKSYN